MSDEQSRHTIECDFCFGRGVIQLGALMPNATGTQICPKCQGRGFITEECEVDSET